ncbi:hypothetical protein T08_12959 [Trichinella sp. T8]|nr:hypothetical protein T08_12959 [Trichinella sp. T8]
MFQDFLFGLQNIVNLKGTLLDCWGRPHPTLEKHIYKAGNSSKNSVHDSINPFIGKECDTFFFFSSCGLSFVQFVKQFVEQAKFVKQIALLYRARYSAHFDTKLSSISCLAEKFNKIDVINLLISLYLEVLGLTSQCSQ